QCAVAYCQRRATIEAIKNGTASEFTSITAERTVVDGQRSTVCYATTIIPGVVTAEGATVDRKRRVSISPDATAGAICRVTADGAVDQRKRGAFVENAAATTEFRSKPVADRKALYRDRTSGHEIENAESRGVLRSRDRQEVRARAANDDAPVDDKLGTGQRDGLPLEGGIEIDCVAVIRISKRLTQRAGAAVVCVGDGDDICVSGHAHCTN